MYNAEFKDRFLNDIKQVGLAKQLFDHSEQYEISEDLDLCKLPTDQVKQILSNYSGYRSVNLNNILGMLRRYCRYCKSNGVAINDDLLKITKDIDLTDGAKRYLVSSPADLYDILNLYFYPPEMESVDCLYRCFLWCAYMGIPFDISKKLLKTKREDLNLKKKYIIVNEDAFELYDESIDDFYNLKYLESFKIYDPRHIDISSRDRVFSMYLFRGVDTLRSNGTGFAAHKTMLRTIERKQNEITYDRVLQYVNLYMSGVFYRAYQVEQMGLEPNFSKFLYYKIGEISMDSLKIKGYTTNRKEAIQRMYRNLLLDYNTWKRAFYSD